MDVSWCHTNDFEVLKLFKMAPSDATSVIQGALNTKTFVTSDFAFAIIAVSQIQPGSLI